MGRLCPGHRGKRTSRAATENLHSARQALGDSHVDAVDQERLASASRRQADARQPGSATGIRHGERAGTCPHGSVQRQLAEQRAVIKAIARELSTGRKHRACDGQIESRPGLRHVARREVRSYATGGELEARVQDGRVHALARLPHRCVGEADDGERRQPAAHVHLHGDVAGVKSVEREGVSPGQHRVRLPVVVERACRQARRRLRWDSLSARRRAVRARSLRARATGTASAAVPA